MPAKLKTVEVAGKTYAEISDGKPIIVEDDGKEVAFDFVHTAGTIARLNGEAKAHREAKEAAETKLKSYENIDDPDAARKALDVIKNLSSGELKTAAQVDEIKRAAIAAAEQKVTDAARASGERIKALESDLGKATNDLYGEKVGGAFSRSKFITDKVAIPADLIQAQFGSRFKVEEGKIVGYDAAGNKLYSRAKPGELAEFDEALETMVDSYAHRDSILKGTNQSGSGARQANGHGNGGAKTMQKAAFDALPPLAQAQLMNSKDRPALVE